MRPADHVSRRNFLQAGALGVAGLAAVRPRVAWGQNNGEAKRGGTLVVRSGPLRGIDPHLETWAAALQVIHQTYNALLKFNHDGTKILPDLAESWEQKDDLTYSFRLRQGVKFHNVAPVNGRELTSEDVKYSIERQMTDQPGKFQHAYFFLGKLASIQTPDKYTIVFKTKEPYAPFLNYIASPWTVIVAREAVEKHGDLQRHAIGTGPFIMQEYRREQEAVFVKNPAYFKKGLPYLDEVRLQYVIDPVAATAAFRGQQTDISLLEFADVPSIKASNAKIKVAEITTMFPIHRAADAALRRAAPAQAPLHREEGAPGHPGRHQAGRVHRDRAERLGRHHDRPHPHLPQAVGAARVGAAGVRSQEGQAPAHRGRLRQRLRDRAHRRQPRRQREERPGGEGSARPGGHPGQPEADGDGPVLQQELLVRLLHERAHRADRGGARGGHPALLRGQRDVLPVGESRDSPPDRRAGQDPGTDNVFLYTPIAHYGVQPWVKNYTVPINAYDQRYEEIWLDGKKA